MITLNLLPNFLQVSIPPEMQSQAPELLAEIWESEFGSKLTVFLELTETVQKFVERAKFNLSILVYQ